MTRRCKHQLKASHFKRPWPASRIRRVASDSARVGCRCRVFGLTQKLLRGTIYWSDLQCSSTLSCRLIYVILQGCDWLLPKRRGVRDQVVGTEVNCRLASAARASRMQKSHGTDRCQTARIETDWPSTHLFYLVPMVYCGCAIAHHVLLGAHILRSFSSRSVTKSSAAESQQALTMISRSVQVTKQRISEFEKQYVPPLHWLQNSALQCAASFLKGWLQRGENGRTPTVPQNQGRKPDSCSKLQPCRQVRTLREMGILATLWTM